MGHANIYINKENEKSWEELTHKSAFVNRLLYLKFHGDLDPWLAKLAEDGGEPTYGVEPIKMSKKEAAKIKYSPQGKVAMMPKDAEKASTGGLITNTEERIAAQKKLCRIHGVRLDSRGKCLQKGCKYA